MRRLYKFVERLLPFVDVLVFPFVYPAALLLKAIRRGGVQRMPLSKRALLSVGVFPIRNHYYEPQFDGFESGAEVRELPGIDWNAGRQLQFLDSFDYADEIRAVFARWNRKPAFDLDNDAFAPGDAEIWYSVVRSRKPRAIIEIGSGHSTLLAVRAVEMNRAEDPGYSCRHVCIEPYEAPWLESTGVTVMREKVERVPPDAFRALGANDLLFIDSSHVIRPRGDVVTEYLQILPSLNAGVLVHIHDIFSPRGYPDAWTKDKVLFWNEQYLLEAFLTHNRDWEIVAALNYLHHAYYDRLKARCPFLKPEHEPGSFYLTKAAAPNPRP